MRRAIEGAPALHFEASGREVSVVSAVEAYRLIAASWVAQSEVVWELGAATGATTALLAQAAKEVVAVEKAPEKLEKLRRMTEEHGKVRVVAADALTASPRDALEGDQRADWLFVDLGGDAPPWRTMAVAERWAEALACGRIVVRNTKLYEALMSCRGSADAHGHSGGNGILPMLHSDHALEARATQGADEGVRAPTPVLLEWVREATGPEVAARLVNELAGGTYRQRKRLTEALSRLGGAALVPLARLVADKTAPMVGRRAAADMISEIVAGSSVIPDDLQSSLPGQWAVARGLAGRGREPGSSGRAARLTELVAMEQGGAVKGELLAAMVADEDEFSRFIARRQLRKRPQDAAQALAEEIGRKGLAARETARALEALGVCEGATPQQVVEWCGDAGARLACAVLGVADQQWAAELLAAFAQTPQARQVAEALEALREAAQRRAKRSELERRLAKVIAAGASPEDLREAIAASPHPWMRRVAELSRSRLWLAATA